MTAFPMDCVLRSKVRPRILLRRFVLFLSVFFTTSFATIKWINYLPSDASYWIQVALVLLFALTFFWISLFFFSSLAGFFCVLKKKRAVGLIRVPFSTPLKSKSVILMPVYNEDPKTFFSRLSAIAKDLSKTGQNAFFDFFIISDTTQPDIWLMEEKYFIESKSYFDQLGFKLFYRRRPYNKARKSGNIEDFCVRFGALYDFMIVLDADSLMRGDTLVKMVQLMEANSSAGIIQAPPALINGCSRFSRIQQFSGHVYGPIITTGLAWWQVWDSNYWGHNAIIRVKAFMESCSLPVLSGKVPFGGPILSHDFVEAALIRRSGWLAWMLPELRGSYEECPPSLIDFAIRDRRWCQGNLQHARILLSKNLHPISRIHFLTGIMSYLSSPLWFLFLVLGISVALGRVFFPPAYFSSVKTLFPTWPVFDYMGVLTLFAVSMSFLIIPKILGVLSICLNTRQCRRFGGVCLLLLGLLMEIIVSILIAPIMMLFQTQFVFEILLGVDSGWHAQNRGSNGTSWIQSFKYHWKHTFIGIFTLCIIYIYTPELFLWILPVVVGLIISIPFSVWLSRRGKICPKLFAIPEEKQPPYVLNTFNDILRTEKVQNEADVFMCFLKNPDWLNAHIVLLSSNGPAPRIETDTQQHLEQKVMDFIIYGKSLNLTDKEKIACLYNPDMLRRLMLKILVV